MFVYIFNFEYLRFGYKRILRVVFFIIMLYSFCIGRKVLEMVLLFLKCNLIFVVEFFVKVKLYDFDFNIVMSNFNIRLIYV